MNPRLINLMPVSYRQRLGVHRVRRRFVLYFALAGVFLAVLFGSSRWTLIQRQRIVTRLTGEVEQIESLKTKTATTYAQAEAIQVRLDEYERLAMPVEPSQVLAVLSELTIESVSLDELSLSVIEQLESRSDMEELRDRAKKSKGKEEAPKRMLRTMVGEIKGVAWEDHDFPIFLERLADHPLFESVQLDYDRSRSVDGGMVREFRIRLEIDLDARYEPALASVEGEVLP